eukprot:2665084-Alexandrium_andersonii.AAC.1
MRRSTRAIWPLALRGLAEAQKTTHGARSNQALSLRLWPGCWAPLSLKLSPGCRPSHDVGTRAGCT